MRNVEGEANIDQFTMNHSKPVLAGETEEVVGYSWDGLVIDNPEHPHCLCKTVKDSGTQTTRCCVKFNMTTGRMVSPVEDGDLRRRGDWTAAGRYGFRSVTRTAFDLYLNFIKTNNAAYLRQAEREVDL